MNELDVMDAIAGLEQTVRLQIVNKTVLNFEEHEINQAPQVPIWIEAVLESIHPRMLLVKPEGQRQWKWWEMWCTEHLELDWVIKDEGGNLFRVMSRQDWSQAGYYHYELVEGPVP